MHKAGRKMGTGKLDKDLFFADFEGGDHRHV
jgi:hypothetical protein